MNFFEILTVAFLLIALVFGVCAFFVALTWLQVKDAQKGVHSK